MMLISLITIANPCERDKVEQIYVKYKRLMYYVAFSVLNDKDNAEDAVHESFFRIINHLEKFQNISCNKTKGLIVIITKNISIDILRKKKKITEINLQEVAYSLENNEASPADFVTTAEGYASLVRTISRLDEKYADVLQLRYLYDYRDNEIAQFLNISNDLVRVRLHRAKKKLREMIREEEL